MAQSKVVKNLLPYSGRILCLGCGSVAQCALPLVLDILEMDPAQITVIDMRDNQDKIAHLLAKGIKYIVKKITPENHAETLAAHLSSGDLVLDLAWEIDTCDTLQWCHDNNVLYVNTSLEVWDPLDGGVAVHPRDRTLYKRHQHLKRMVQSWKEKGPTGIFEHGANPGIVSHFVKRGLTDLATKLIGDESVDIPRAELKAALEAGDFGRIAMLSGTKVIHIAERDTQITSQPKQPNEFVNTWSIEGFFEEGLQPSEICWGTHEKRMPPGAWTHTYGPGHCIALPQMGVKTWLRSFVPGNAGGGTTGMVMPHGEVLTIGEHLTVKDADGIPIYRPTVNFVYCPCDAAVSSMHELEMRDYKLQEKQRIMNADIISGEDKLGVLLLGHPYKAWWTGSLLDIEETRRLVPGQNATTLQVASAAVAAVVYMIRHPNEGVQCADDLPYKELLEVAMPYMGEFISQPFDWDPVSTRNDRFAGWNGVALDTEDPWQWINFQPVGAAVSY